MRTLKELTAVCLSVAAFLCAGPALAAKPPKVFAAVVDGNNMFALELYGRLSAAEGNLFLSPYSISTALAMTYAGARGNTEAEMAKALHLGPNNEALHADFGELVRQLQAAGKTEHYKLHVANALWGQKDYKFRDEFTDLVRKTYDAGLKDVDFARDTEKARTTINAWVEENTKDKIKDLLKPGVLAPTTRLVLTNAIYFKGDWQRKFKKDQTKDEPFTLVDGKKVNVPMMRQEAELRYFEQEDFQALDLPYAGGELSMVVLLPRRADGIREFEKKLTQKDLTGWLAGLRPREVKLSLPRFKATSEFSLKDTLIALGMKDAFVPDTADFSGMDGTRNLFIQAVVHKAFVDVNEEGTEAAAATAVVVGLTSVREPEPPAVFRADHPFVFLIRDNRTASVLFMGRVMNPKE